MTTHQAFILDSILRLTIANGCPPSRSQIAGAADINRSSAGLTHTLKRLQALGYIKQGYSRGPWVALKDPDGAQLRLRLVPHFP